MVVFLGYDPMRDFIYRTITDYFQDPVLVKTRTKSHVDGMDMYVGQSVSYLLKERRFLLVMVTRADDIPYGTASRLSRLMWKTLQTRVIVDDDEFIDPVREFSYDVRREAFHGYTLSRVDTTDDWTQYRVDPYLPLTVFLFHKKKGAFEYSPTGTLVAALETFQTLLVLESSSPTTLSHVFGS